MDEIKAFRRCARMFGDNQCSLAAEHTGKCFYRPDYEQLWSEAFTSGPDIIGIGGAVSLKLDPDAVTPAFEFKADESYLDSAHGWEFVAGHIDDAGSIELELREPGKAVPLDTIDSLKAKFLALSAEERIKFATWVIGMV